MSMDDWSELEFRLFDEMAGPNDAMYEDWRVQAMYEAAMWNWDISTEDRVAIRNELHDYLWDEYGVDFNEVFDWEAYREAYG